MELYMNPYFIFKDIANESSKKGKEAIIKKHANNNDFLEILDFVYNPMITTGISKKKINKQIAENSGLLPLENIYEVMDYLKEHNTGTDKDIEIIQSFLNGVRDDAMREFLKSVVTKDLKIGITSKTINKAMGYNYIPSFDVMLASKYEGQDLGEFAVTLKLDGIRCVALNYETGVKFFTRQGQEILGLNELAEQFKLFPKGMVYDGELLKVNTEGLKSDDLFRETQKIVRKDGEKKGIEFVVFDSLSIEEFKNGVSELDYKNRLGMFDSFYHFGLAEKPSLIRQVEMLYMGDNVEVIEPLLSSVTKAGLEGLMINTLDGLYEAKRSKALLKVKEFHTVDLEIVGYEEHKQGNKLGAFIVDYKGHKVNVGSGFSDRDREIYWKLKEQMIGRVAEVKYFEESRNQNGGISLRFPTFKTVREEGKEVSYH